MRKNVLAAILATVISTGPCILAEAEDFSESVLAESNIEAEEKLSSESTQSAKRVGLLVLEEETLTSCQSSKVGHVWTLEDGTENRYVCQLCGEEKELLRGTGDIIAIGICGDQCYWSINQSGVLRIWGSGAMYSYGSPSSATTYSQGKMKLGLIPWMVFRGTSVKTIKVEKGVTSISEGAFACMNWENSKPFAYTQSISDISLPDTIEQIGEKAFWGVRCSSLTVPKSVKNWSEGFLNAASIDTVVFEDGIQQICKIGQNTVKKFVLPSSITTISERAFLGSRLLETVNLPYGITDIPTMAFSGCQKLKNIEIPASVTQIGQEAFDGCNALTSITIPSGVTTISYRAFSECENLKSITIPISVKVMDYINVLCDKLTDIYYEGSENEWNNITIYGSEYLDNVTIHYAKATPKVLISTDKENALSGECVQLTAKVDGGDGDYTYKFLICDANGNWYKLRDFEESNIFYWVTGTAGKKTIYVDAKDRAGTVIRGEIPFEVSDKKLTVDLSVSPSNSIITGSQIKLNATAAGGTGNYTYSFLIHNLENDTWYRWAFDKSAEHVWTANGSGNREFFAEVKDEAGTVVRSEAMKVTVKSAQTPLGITGKVSTSQVTEGNTVTLSASATGGAGDYTYSFLIHNLENDTWYRWAFDKNAEHVWTANGSGNREFFAEVKDAAGTVVRSEAMKVTVGSGSNTDPLRILASANQTQVASGTTVTISALAAGGSGSYTYSFLVHNLANDSWYRFGDFTTASSYTWTAGSAGTREFFVEAKDANGTVVRSSAVIIVVK